MRGALRRPRAARPRPTRARRTHVVGSPVYLSRPTLPLVGSIRRWVNLEIGEAANRNAILFIPTEGPPVITSHEYVPDDQPKEPSGRIFIAPAGFLIYWLEDGTLPLSTRNPTGRLDFGTLDPAVEFGGDGGA
jgi:hypothetical protein